MNQNATATPSSTSLSELVTENWKAIAGGLALVGALGIVLYYKASQSGEKEEKEVKKKKVIKKTKKPNEEQSIHEEVVFWISFIKCE